MKTLSIDFMGSTTSFGDERLNLRFQKILRTLLLQVECSIPQAFKQWGQTKAVYRFLSNNKVTQEKILSAELNHWSEKHLSECPIILALHDTTELDFTGHRSEKQLGCLAYENQLGLFLHNTLLCNAEGMAQTVFHQHYWSRDVATLGERKNRKHLPIDEKESGRWVNSIERVQQYFNVDKTRTVAAVINICDREGDIYELLSMAKQGNSHYIVRSCNNRRINNGQEKLWEQVKKERPRGQYTIELKDRITLQKRKATIEVKWLEDIVLFPPYRKSNKKPEPISLNMIYVEEVNTPNGVTPISWKLLTSLELSTLQGALMIITYYSYRWRIETFHYILKQGCKVEQLQLEQKHNLKNAITLYSLMACRLLAFMHLTREKPQDNINKIGFTTAQYVLLCNYLEKNYHVNISQYIKEKPTLKYLTELIGLLGGYQKHNSKHPGIKVMWRGLKELEIILNCLKLFSEKRYG